MENTTKTSQKYAQGKIEGFFDLVNDLLSDLPERSQIIVKKRFGIGTKEPQTLEKIGQENSVTRERVRQIIADAAKKIAQKRETENFRQAEEKILWTINRNNGIMEEQKIIQELSGGDFREANAAAFFAATSGRIEIQDEKGALKKVWMSDRTVLSKIKAVENVAKAIFAGEHQLLTEEEIIDRIRQQLPEFSVGEVASYLAVLLAVKKNKFGKWGLAEWKEISPKGTRERIYLVLKEEKKPMHFTEIAKLIDEYRLGKRKAHPQTVHNELIKDERFVLVGRGTYALKEWGYEKGTIKDVLQDILKKHAGPMGKEEILQEVLRRRKVKKATILINLNNQKIFARQNNGWTIKR